MASLNARALAALNEHRPDLSTLGVVYSRRDPDSPELFDFTAGTPEAGLLLTRIAMAGLGEAECYWQPLFKRKAHSHLRVATTRVADACLRSQVAAYELRLGGYSGYVSGPIRTRFASDPYASALGPRDTAPEQVVAIIEGTEPTPEALAKLATRAGVEPQDLVVLFAPTQAWACIIQVLGRIVETAVKRIFDLKVPGFDVQCIQAAYGTVPFCPSTTKAEEAMAFANEASIYGASVFLTADADDEVLAELVPRVPSSAARDLYGVPFAGIMAKAAETGTFNFTAIEEVFAPAAITIFNVRTCRLHSAGQVDEEQLQRAFGL